MKQEDYTDYLFVDLDLDRKVIRETSNTLKINQSHISLLHLAKNVPVKGLRSSQHDKSLDWARPCFQQQHSGTKNDFILDLFKQSGKGHGSFTQGLKQKYYSTLVELIFGLTHFTPVFCTTGSVARNSHVTAVIHK